MINNGFIASDNTSDCKAFYFDIEPQTKPRMVRSDKYKKRECVQRYWAYKDTLILLAKSMNFPEIKDRINLLEFYISMPVSWSKKKKEKYIGKYHQQKPDIDNLLKGFQDALLKEDKQIADVLVRKYWSDKGFIKVIV